MKIKLYFLLIILLISCKKESVSTHFIYKESSHTGISFINRIENTPELNILKYLYFYNGAGVATGDFNNDGKIDIYFTSNMESDRLYLNNGNFRFNDVTEKADISNASGWTNGVTVCDINNDGLLDLYICKTSGFLSFEGHNLLYVNQGVEEGIPKFKELSKDYGLAFSGFSTQSSFLDFDLDGDLDLFIMNHSIYPNRNYGKGSARLERSEVSGDKLFENREGFYYDVTETSKIFEGKIGYGLGLAVGDLNNDRYPDIYVGNDFFENDYLYINQQDGTFQDQNSLHPEKLGHTSHFSMGNAIKDINNDGYMDIVSLDMLPADIKTYKTSGLDYPFQTYHQYLNNGYAPQFMQNTLHLNSERGYFSDIAKMSGISATDWSWSPLVADFDNDGHMDLYITNGILGATNDMDFINFISNEKIQRKIDTGLDEADLSLLDAIPSQKRSNYLYKNNGDLTFQDVSKTWLTNKTSYSNGATYADLDNDGDLDIIVNNINEEAFIIENTQQKNHYINFKFVGTEANTLGIGTKVYVYANNDRYVQENYTTHGYLSAKAPELHFGLDSLHQKIDSVKVLWPNAYEQTLISPAINSEVIVNAKNAERKTVYEIFKTDITLSLNDSILPFKHKDRLTLDYNIDPLIPFSSSNQGPSAAVGDVNGDKLDDIFIGGAKGQPSELYVQQSQGSFSAKSNFKFEDYLPIAEVTASCLVDLNSDGLLDLICGFGGNEFIQGEALRPVIYWNKGDEFEVDTSSFGNLEINASQISSIDLDLDGDMDVIINSDIQSRQFGKSSKQFIFENDGKGKFLNTTSKWGPAFSNLGNVKFIDWADINNDGYPDAVVAGYWMPITILLNENGNSFKQSAVSDFLKTDGWWNVVKCADFDNDGDLDLIAGNWGLNTRLKASVDQPITLYINDFDDNGRKEPILTYFQNGSEEVFGTKDDMVKAMPFLNKKYLSYESFSKAKLNDLFAKTQLEGSIKRKVYQLSSSYFENVEGTFIKKPLPNIYQLSSIHDLVIEDFNKDGYLDVFLVGNSLDLNTQLGRLDGSHGQLLLNDSQGFFKYASLNVAISGSSRQIIPVKKDSNSGWLILRNNDTPIFISINE